MTAGSLGRFIARIRRPSIVLFPLDASRPIPDPPRPQATHSTTPLHSDVLQTLAPHRNRERGGRRPTQSPNNQRALRRCELLRPRPSRCHPSKYLHPVNVRLLVNLIQKLKKAHLSPNSRRNSRQSAMTSRGPNTYRSEKNRSQPATTSPADPSDNPSRPNAARTTSDRVIVLSPCPPAHGSQTGTI